jgi:hypothetical protein
MSLAMAPGRAGRPKDGDARRDELAEHVAR